jgi:hypothetical protein
VQGDEVGLAQKQADPHRPNSCVSEEHPRRVRVMRDHLQPQTACLGGRSQADAPQPTSPSTWP